MQQASWESRGSRPGDKVLQDSRESRDQERRLEQIQQQLENLGQGQERTVSSKLLHTHTLLHSHTHSLTHRPTHTHGHNHSLDSFLNTHSHKLTQGRHMHSSYRILTATHMDSYALSTHTHTNHTKYLILVTVVNITLKTIKHLNTKLLPCNKVWSNDLR